MALALEARAFEVPDRGSCRGTDRWWQRGGENETGRVAAHRVAKRRACRDIAAEAPEGLGERSFDHVQTPHGALELSLSAAARAVHSDRVDLVGIGHGAVARCEIADAVDWRHVAVHGVKRLEHDELRPVRAGGLQQFLEMAHVVVAEDLLLAMRLAHASIIEL